MTRLPALAVGCALLSSLSWGFGISAVKHALDYLPPAHLLLVQLVFSSVVIASLAAIEWSPRPSLRQTMLGGATGILEFGLGYGVGTIGLYLTTASKTLSAEQLAKEHAGSVFKIDLDIAGQPETLITL